MDWAVHFNYQMRFQANEIHDESLIYLAVRTDMFRDFQRAYSEGPVNIEDWGVVLEAGLGKPSPEVRKRMTEEFNFNHEEAISVPAVAEDAETSSLARTPPFTQDLFHEDSTVEPDKDADE